MPLMFWDLPLYWRAAAGTGGSGGGGGGLTLVMPFEEMRIDIQVFGTVWRKQQPFPTPKTDDLLMGVKCYGRAKKRFTDSSSLSQYASKESVFIMLFKRLRYVLKRPYHHNHHHPSTCVLGAAAS